MDRMSGGRNLQVLLQMLGGEVPTNPTPIVGVNQNPNVSSETIEAFSLELPSENITPEQLVIGDKSIWQVNLQQEDLLSEEPSLPVATAATDVDVAVEPADQKLTIIKEYSDTRLSEKTVTSPDPAKATRADDSSTIPVERAVVDTWDSFINQKATFALEKENVPSSYTSDKSANKDVMVGDESLKGTKDPRGAPISLSPRDTPPRMPPESRTNDTSRNDPATRRFGPAMNLPYSASVVAVERSSRSDVPDAVVTTANATAEGKLNASTLTAATTPTDPAASLETGIEKPPSSLLAKGTGIDSNDRAERLSLQTYSPQRTDFKPSDVTITHKENTAQKNDVGKFAALPEQASVLTTGQAQVPAHLKQAPIVGRAPDPTPAAPQTALQRAAASQTLLPSSAGKPKNIDRQMERVSRDIEVAGKTDPKPHTQLTAGPTFPPQSTVLPLTAAAKPVEVFAGPDVSQTKADLQTQISTADNPEPLKPEKPLSRTEAVARPVMQQLAQAARQSNDGSIEVKLSPEELGRVRLALTPGEANIVVHISVERPETLELIRRNIEMFAQTLRQEGFSNPDFSFEHSGGEASGGDTSPPSAMNDEDQSSNNKKTDLPRLAIGTYGQLDIRL